MKIIAVIQARMESTRLPGKVLKPVAGEPMLKRIVERVSQSRCLDSVIVATSCNSADNAIEEFCRQEGILCFRGSQDNVLERYYQCSSRYQGEIIIRLTADNVFVDPDIIMDAVQCFRINGRMDYLYYREGLPLGMAVEVFTMEALRKAYQEAEDAGITGAAAGAGGIRQYQGGHPERSGHHRPHRLRGLPEAAHRQPD